MSPALADRVRAMLVDVVTGGTAIEADLGTFLLAGKTGTARRTIGGRYVDRQYFASFAGLFPARHPQFVIVVKLDSPKEEYSGGSTAAPVSKALLEAALAARDAALDRRALADASSQRASLGHVAALTTASDTGRANGSVRLAGAPAPERDSSAPSSRARRMVVRLPYRGTAAARAAQRVVPDVRGREMRDAVRALHEAGFRVHVARGPAGLASTTSPVAGSLAPAGSVVRLSRE
jgi:hypothetical protein